MTVPYPVAVYNMYMYVAGAFDLSLGYATRHFYYKHGHLKAH